jgi:Family of unknown function (DUF6011)
MRQGAIMSRDPIFDGLDDDMSSSGMPEDAALPILRNKFDSAAAARQFVESNKTQNGSATITLESLKTGNRFTYKISQARDKETGIAQDCYFVGLLCGPNNDSDYKYIGRIARSVFWSGRKYPKPGDISKDAPSVRAFDWAWRALARGELPDQLAVWHEGKCGRCGRKLTVPESVASGFGPECRGKV